MSVPVHPSADSPKDPPSERSAAAHAGGAEPQQALAQDLRELLGHMTDSWDDQRRLLARQLHDSL
ncbi:MAG: hypothetical protein JWP59_3305, partial [Massilia sp.]|nr:hypothetical protein [Massilia sp.]